MKCGICNGKGRLSYLTADKNGKRITKVVDCIPCKGTGEVQQMGGTLEVI